MEGTVLTIKFAMLVAMELFVIGALGPALVAGLVQIVRSQVGASRRADQIAPETHPAGL
jgi:hypothetical protein